MGLLADARDQPANLSGDTQGTATAESPAQCLDLGLVRAVDTDRSLLYLLTPLPLDQLQRVNVLQVGSSLPEQRLLAQLEGRLLMRLWFGRLAGWSFLRRCCRHQGCSHPISPHIACRLTPVGRRS